MEIYVYECFSSSESRFMGTLFVNTAKRNEHYYFISYNMNVEKTFDLHEIDRDRCEIGNYFPTEDIAEQFNLNVTIHRQFSKGIRNKSNK